MVQIQKYINLGVKKTVLSWFEKYGKFYIDNYKTNNNYCYHLKYSSGGQ